MEAQREAFRPAGMRASEVVDSTAAESKAGAEAGFTAGVGFTAAAGVMAAAGVTDEEVADDSSHWSVRIAGPRGLRASK
jgi:hypothetical protein